MDRIIAAAILLALLASCTQKKNVVELQNQMKGKMKATAKLMNTGEKKFPLDSISAPRIRYVQILDDGNNNKSLTFLNTYANAIYVYDYNTLGLKKIVKFSKKDKEGINVPLGYYIKNFDSIYIYNKTNNELALINDSGRVVSRISLINKQPFHDLSWIYRYPQYYPSTTAPVVGAGQQLIFPGQYMLSLPDSIAGRFRFEAHVDLNNDSVRFFRQYPPALYGNNIFWENEGLFTNVYSDVAPDNKMIYSFPVSHDVFVADNDKEGYTSIYGGSNEAGAITSFEKKMPSEELQLRVCKTDLYAAIRYDRYRKVYYRFLRKAMPEATYTSAFKDKPLSVVMFDEHFKYMGETIIGTCDNFNWENAFVTEEGLNIEYIDKKDLSESHLYLKIFKPANL